MKEADALDSNLANVDREVGNERVKTINWEGVFWVIILPILGFIAAAYTPLRTKTAIWAVIYHVTTGVGITAGYHRLWAHRSYSATLPLRIWLAAFGGAAIENSIRTWSADHRAHHRYTDTNKDPYSVHKGLLHAHIGWLVFKPDPVNVGLVDVRDLDKDPVVIWQHRHYVEVALVMGFLLPCCVAGLWSDWQGGLPERNLMVPIRPYEMVHLALKQAGLAHNLKEFRRNEIEKGRLQQEQKKLDRAFVQLQRPLDQLPLIEWDEFQENVRCGRSLVVVAGIVHDIADFSSDHPGGKGLVESFIGKDATAVFNGGVYDHSRAAHGTLETLRVGVIRGGCEVEARKREWSSTQA